MNAEDRSNQLENADAVQQRKTDLPPSGSTQALAAIPEIRREAMQVVAGATEKPETLESADTVLIVRGNTLFARWIPYIQQLLTKKGRKTFAQVFPRGTAERTIDEWIDASREILQQKKKILTDQTCLGAGNERPVLDRAFNDATLAVFSGSNIDRGLRGKQSFEESEIEQINTAFTRLMSNIVSKKMPDYVALSMVYIGAHFAPENEDENYLRQVAGARKAHPGSGETRDKDYWAVSQLRHCLESAGIPAERIMVLPADYESARDDFIYVDRGRLSGHDKRSEYIFGIQDRHVKGHEDERGDISPDCTITLQWPLENFVQDAIQAGLIDDSGDFEEKFKAALAAEIGKIL